MKALHGSESWRKTVRAGLHASRDSFYRTARAARQVRPGVNVFPLALLPRRCPRCGEHSIIGHGRRRKQAHDAAHDWIWVRRGLCPRCRVTFTILPDWSPPYGHYSFGCRQQAWHSICNGGGWEQSVPQIKDANRFPDVATLRRWTWRRLLSLRSISVLSCLFCVPTILAWDWGAAARNLLLEADST